MLPNPHIPRPGRTDTLAALLRAYRLVVLSAGAFAGKTTLLAELIHNELAMRIFWYTVDEVDDSARVLLEGLAHAVSGAVPVGNEAHLLAHIVGVLDADLRPVALVMDDVHRSTACLPLVARLLRYLPPQAHLLLSGRPQSTPRPLIWRWLDDQNQVTYLTGADLRLDAEEQERFRAATGRAGGGWAVEYRLGGHPAIVDGLRRGVLPALTAELRAVVNLLGVLPVATVPVLAAALSWPAADVEQILTCLQEETILIERLDTTHFRLGEAARTATCAELNLGALAALRDRAAAALERHDPAQAAHLFAQSGAIDRAVSAANRVSWWEWREQQSLGGATAALLPPAALCRCSALALVVAHHRFVEQGPPAAHALARSIRPASALERIERVRLLAHCCYVRALPWSLERHVGELEVLLATPDPGMTVLVRSYGCAAIGSAYFWLGRHGAAADAVRLGLDLLELAGGDDARIAYVRLLCQRSLAHIEDRLGHFDEAKRLYTEAHAQVVREKQPFVELEITNNWAVLLQQTGEHTQSADMLRQALASPWSADRGLHGLLQASLADALDALGDRAGAARALHSALADAQEKDVYGLRGHLHAMLALLLVEGGHAVAARAELEAGAPPNHPATLLVRALLRDPREPELQSTLAALLEEVAVDRPLQARVRAHLARICAVQGDRPRSRKWADMVAGDRSYHLTPREAAILGPHTHRVRGARPLATSLSPPRPPVTVRFFGSPVVAMDGQPVGSPWWAPSKGRELLWYALAHGQSGFTREEACADLFPDADTEHGLRAVRNLLYELRNLLRVHCGVEALQAPQNGRLRLLPDDLSPCWETDTHTLEGWLTCLRTGEIEGVGNLSLLLTGRYLADLNADWTRPFRHYWESEALHALDLAANQYERAGRPSEALGCLQRAVEFSPDDATLLRRVMLLYHAMDDQGGLRATYLLHRRAMREELSVDPDPNVTTLYETLIRP